MGGVVAAVPCVEQGVHVEGHGPTLGVLEAAAELLRGEGLQEHDPAGVEAFDELERPLDWGGAGIVQLGPGFLVVGHDGRPVFGEREAGADGGVGVGVRDVMDELADGPAALAVRGIDLAGVEAVDGIAQVGGELGKNGDGLGEVFGRDDGWTLEAADGIAGVQTAGGVDGGIVGGHSDDFLGIRGVLVVLKDACWRMPAIARVCSPSEQARMGCWMKETGMRCTALCRLLHRKWVLGGAMRVFGIGVMMLAGMATRSCGKTSNGTPAAQETLRAEAKRVVPAGDQVGFDRNLYPGDEAMARLKKQFAYTGYWLTAPPGETVNGWVGKRTLLREQGYGFLVLADGRFDKQILAAGKGAGKTTPAQLGRQDAAAAVAAAQREGFPAKTILFVDQEEGGHLLPEQEGYLFGWTEAVAATEYRPGVYVSGQPLADDEHPGRVFTTAQDIRDHVMIERLHPVALWVYQDACAPKGPATGCTVTPPARDASGTPDVVAWQYAQSPRRPELTQSCRQTYGADGNCYPPGEPGLLVDLNVAGSADPSAGR